MLFLNNIIWILFAYMIGSINFSMILTSISKDKKNIKEVGSGNAGATNAMRAYGFKFGFIIFILDASKSYWFGFFLGVLESYIDPFNGIIPQMCLIFVIIGHIFPVYFRFKGGKGAAALLGAIASISLILAAIGAILFLIVVGITKYVSLGSITIPYILSGLAFLIPKWDYIDTTITYGPFWVSPLCLFLASAIVASSHWENIIRLLNNTERKTTFLSMGQMDVTKNEKDKLAFKETNSLSNQSNKNTKSIIDEAIDIK